MAPPTSNLNLNVEAISGICGSVSIACWVVVFSPQIIQNFQNRNADALSVQFIIIWLLGDLFNILGAVLQGVLPTMIILAIYYTIADLVLLLQCFYYRGFTLSDEPTPRSKPNAPSDPEPSERSSLLPSQASSMLRERRGSDWSALSLTIPHTMEAPEAPPPTFVQTTLWNTVVVVMVIAAGVFGWFLGQRATEGDHGPSQGDGKPLEFNVLGQFFGYLCAIAYIASRLPQLILNWRRKTTEGLSMLFFLFACLGNITYVLSILAYEPRCPDTKCDTGEAGRLYARYILVNLSWLAGAGVTLFLDFGVFAQYFIYNRADNEDRDYPVLDEVDHVSIEENQWDPRPLLERSNSR